MTCHIAECVRDADLSPCGRYRFRLTRREPQQDWPLLPLATRKHRTVAWVMCNPSTADADVDDASVRKVWGFSQRWGYRSVIVVNTNPERCTDPREQSDYVKESAADTNDDVLRCVPVFADRIVVAWGRCALPRHVERTLRLLLASRRRLHALRETAAGQPCHPLMLPYSLEPFHWRPEV